MLFVVCPFVTQWKAVLSAGGFAIVLLDMWKSDPLAGKDIEQACVSW